MEELDFSFVLDRSDRFGIMGKPSRLFEAYLEWNSDDSDESQSRALREAAHTTSDFATYLSAVIRKRFFEAYAAIVPNWRQYATTIDVPDFRPDTLVGLGEFSDLEQVGEEDQYTYGDIGQLTGPQVFLFTWGRLMSIHRKVFINDDLGRIKTIPSAMGRAAARTLANNVMNVFLSNPTTYDGNALFSVAHNNLDTAVLSDTALMAGITAMRKQTNQNGVRTNVVPRDLIVSVDNQFTAARLLNSTLLGKTDGTGTTNPLQGVLNLIVDPSLTDTNDWYIQGTVDGEDPSGIIVTFLNGVQEPSLLQRTTVQAMGGGAYDPYNLEVDSVDWKIRHDWGVNPGEWRGLYASKPA